MKLANGINIYLNNVSFFIMKAKQKGLFADRKQKHRAANLNGL